MKKFLIKLLRWLLTRLYQVEVHGLEHYHQAGTRVLVVANHASFLDGILLGAFLPDELTFAVNTHIARRRRFKAILSLVKTFPMDPTRPLTARSLIRFMQQERKAVIFPEGRITVTGSLMKIYDGAGMVADKSGASILPIRIDGAQYTPFSRLRGRVRLRWFPKVTLRILPPRAIGAPPEVKGRARRRHAGKALSDIMTDMMFQSGNYRRTLFQALLDARKVHGSGHPVLEDVERRPVTYRRLIASAFILGREFARTTRPGEYVGILLPGACATMMSFMGLQAFGRAPAMLNFTTGVSGMTAACRMTQLRTIVTSRRFIAAARLESALSTLAGEARILYLEDLAAGLSPFDRLRGMLGAMLAPWVYARSCPARDARAPAVVLFTSGSEGAPKGVVLSHENLLANREQLAARIDFTPQDIILNALPLFHSFGLTAGTLLPLLSGMKIFLYPTPLHYRIVPEIAYDINATILFGTNTFLAGYARFAHPYDFYSVRYVFAGAEKLREDTRRIWSERFGVRIFEGYGATETSPALATNTAMENRAGTVGRLLPGVEYFIEPVEGVDSGGRLHVSGPNVMLGYLTAEAPGVLTPPASVAGPGWYDTGDIIVMDEDGFISIAGRARRFAKIGGEMVSLTAAEELASAVWPGTAHAVVTLPDTHKGEMLVLVTEHAGATRSELSGYARESGIGEINVPRRIITVRRMPLLGSGKTDYAGVARLARDSG